MIKMSLFFGIISALILQPAFIWQSHDDGRVITSTDPVSSLHDTWDELLKQYVDRDGNVDYKAFLKSKTTLEEYLDLLAVNVPEDEDPKKVKLAYYINLYNAATVKLILDHYPLESIKDISSPWDQKWIKAADKELSLGEIEHKILRKMGEPRIHFAINCASYSCPKLASRAYTAENLESQLESAAVDFINDTKRNRINPEKAEISQIFKWFRSDFTEDGSLREYLNRYSQNPVGPDTKLTYIKYDWSLNEAK